MSAFKFIIGYVFFSIPNPLYIIFLIYLEIKWFFKSSDTILNQNYDDIQLTNNEYEYYHYMLNNIDHIRSNLSRYESEVNDIKTKGDGTFDERSKKGKEINKNIKNLTDLITSYENFNMDIYKLATRRKEEFIKRISYNRTGALGIIVYILLLVAAFSEYKNLVFNENILKYTTPISQFISDKYFESSHEILVLSSLSLYTFIIQFLYYKLTYRSIYKKLGDTPSLENMTGSKFTTVWANKLKMEYSIPDYEKIN